MRMQLVEPVPDFYAACLACDRRMWSAGEALYADLDGPAFRAYYCGSCTVRRTESFAVGMVGV